MRPGAGTAKKGLILNTDAAFAGYTLFAPQDSTTTYLVDMKGEVVHSWPSEYVPGAAVYLLDDGGVLRCGREPRNSHFQGGGIGGRVERISPDGKVRWSFVYADDEHCLHHDIEPMPNGNVLMIAWEKKTRDQAIAAGRDPEITRGDELWPDCIIEVEPEGATSGRIVWEWHVWDHLVQEFDKDKPNYGVVADHPELVDLNFRQGGPRPTAADIQALRDIGYIGGGESDDGARGRRPEGDARPQDRRPERDAPARDANDSQAGPDGRRDRQPDRRGGRGGRGPGGFGAPDMQADWCHTNAVAYNAKLDQIALSVHNFSEVWIIDHSTTVKEAAGHTGGRYGRGGDLLYRWGNPRAYGAGDAVDQQLFAQHDVRWIPAGMPGAGHLMVFNNGVGRPDGPYSSVIEIETPIDSSGRYKLQRGRAYGPDKPCWEYAAENKAEFFSAAISGAERLPNGNTLICSGMQGRMFEVSAAGKVVWDYYNPFAGRMPPDGRFGPPGGGPFGAGPGGADRDARRDNPTSRPAVGRRDDRNAGLDNPTSRPGGDPRDARRGGGWSPPGADGPFGGGFGGPPGADGPFGGGFAGGPPGVGPGGMPFGGGFGGGPMGGGGGVFRAARLASDHPGVRRLLAERSAKK